MARILVLHGVPTARARLEQAIREAHGPLSDTSIEAADAWHDLEAKMLRWPDGVVVFDPYFEGHFPDRILQRLVSAFVGLHAFIAYSDWHRGVTRDVLALGRWGVRDIVSMDVDDRPLQLASVLARVWRESGVARSLAPYLSALPGDVRRAIEIALATPGELTVRGLARQLSLTPRSLQRLFGGSRLPTPHTVVARCRLLHAARLLSIPQLSTDRVASTLGYADSSSLRRALARHFAVSISQARTPGFVDILAACLFHTSPPLEPSVAFRSSRVGFERRVAGSMPPSWELVAAQGD